ncbi:hypothetical protein [Pseudactinotalea sp. Z1748]|uniref:hypothetical protein n=1 Tax=Pseudactinotalea sp. Z1748 TaxID=3413027 RepID=UPI003C7CA95D
MPAENVSMWAYPWDLKDEGPAAALQRMADAGIGDVKVASVYHSGRFILPHNPRRKVYFPQPGALYFQPDAGWYDTAAIQPPVWSDLPEGFWPQLREETNARGQSLSSWCLGLHNTHVGSTHPEAAVRNAFGDLLMTDLCAANPQVSELVTRTVSNAAQATGADRILLESFEYMPFAHGYHHEVIGVPIAPRTGLLATLCFCRWCTEAGERDGVDVSGLQQWVREQVNTAMEHAFDTAEPFDWDKFRAGFGGQLGRYWQMRNKAVQSLLAAVVAAIRAVSDARIGVLDFGPIYGTPIDGTTWQSGQDVAQIAQIADEVHPTFYLADPAANEASINDYLDLVPDGVQIHPAIRAILPQVSGPESLQRTLAPLQGRVDGVSFYNYGFLGTQAFDWISGQAADFKVRN